MITAFIAMYKFIALEPTDVKTVLDDLILKFLSNYYLHTVLTSF